MSRLCKAGIVFKTVLFIVFFLWETAISTSGDCSMHKSLRSEQNKPIPERLKNELSDLDDFEYLETGIAFLMGKFDIKGASIAVVKDGRLVYAKGLGFAEAEAKESVEPRHLFRVASVSKLITAATIMKLTELGLLDIDDKVFGESGILNNQVYLDFVDPRVKEITVRNLLNHSAGWNNRNADPMTQHQVIAREFRFAPSSVTVTHILRHALTQPLDFDPGFRTSYSNLGYAILGEVIETITGIGYEEYVCEKILLPLGISEMRIGKSLQSDRYENEVKYYDLADIQRFNSIDDPEQVIPLAYGGNNIETLGAAGGWIASPAEILKLVVAIDSLNNTPNLLSSESIRIMTDPRLSGGHTIGWAGTDGDGNWWRTGSLAGTSALVMRQNDGISWAVLFNSSTCRGTNIPREITREMRAALNNLEKWPDHDLFYHIEPPPFLYSEISRLD